MNTYVPSFNMETTITVTREAWFNLFAQLGQAQREAFVAEYLCNLFAGILLLIAFVVVVAFVACVIAYVLGYRVNVTRVNFRQS